MTDWNLVVSSGTLIAVIMAAVRGGMLYGDFRARLDDFRARLERIEKALFNGHFAEKGEVAVRVEHAEQEHAEIRRRLEALEGEGGR